MQKYIATAIFRAIAPAAMDDHLKSSRERVNLSGMDENEEFLNQHMEGMPLETRFRMKRFIHLVADRDYCALSIIRRIEAGMVLHSDALDVCLGTKH